MSTIWKKHLPSQSSGPWPEWLHIHHDRPAGRGLIFAVPLIGGSPCQQVNGYRRLIRHGYDLITFNYAGHGLSGDKFSLLGSLRDTQKVLHQAIRISRSRQLPLLGIACCYGTIPLLHASAAMQQPFDRVVLINAITHFRPMQTLTAFGAYYRQTHCKVRRWPSIMTTVQEFLDQIFPTVAKNQRFFGTLQRNRCYLGRSTAQWCLADPLAAVRLEDTPVLSVYAKNDPVLKVFGVDQLSRHQKQVGRICPHATYTLIEGDHYLSALSAREAVFKAVVGFWDNCRFTERGYGAKACP